MVQEAVCAIRATVVCGACSIEWDRLAAVCQSEGLRDVARVSASMIRASSGILAIRRIQKLRQEESPIALLSLLASVRVLDATDPRDKLLPSNTWQEGKMPVWLLAIIRQQRMSTPSTQSTA